MLQHIPVMWIRLSHTARRNEFRENYREEAMLIQEPQPPARSLLLQNGIQFIMNALGSHILQQLSIAYKQLPCFCIYAQSITHHQTYSPQHTQGIMLKYIVINRAQAPCRNIGKTTCRVNKRDPRQPSIFLLRCHTLLQIPHDLVQRNSHRVECKIPPAQIILDCTSIQRRDIENDFPCILLDNHAAGLFIHMSIVTTEFIGQAASQTGSIAIGDDIPINNWFAEQEIAQRTSNKVGLPVTIVKMLYCLFQNIQGLSVQGYSFKTCRLFFSTFLRYYGE